MQVRNSKELGALVRRQRRALGWSQQTLATAAGVTRPTVAAVEIGKDTARIGLALRMLAALGLGLDVVLLPASRADIDLDEYLHGG